ncbi:MAG: phosphate ABC transporter substrate-binding protein [Gammaproteobacteria bacterium]|nr:phosphate ABC transporter substrate-binding protein [Gammaproteobacteria bacterium]
MLRSLLLSSLFISSSVFAELVVVVGKDSKINSLDESTVENIFLSRTNRYPDGSKAKPIELKNNNYRREFYTRLTGKSPRQLSAYWTTLIFSGKGKPPKKLDDINMVLEIAEVDTGMITYLDASLVTDDLKVVYRFE